MMNKIIIPGVPVSQARMKFSCRGKFAKVYDPRAKEKKELRAFLRDYVKQFYFLPLQHPHLCFVFHMPILASTPKKLLPTMNSGIVKHEKKSDCDNLLKLYLDCLDGILFEGDQKVSLGCTIKLYHPEPKTIIYFSDSSEQLTPDVLPLQIWNDLFVEESYVL